MVFDTYGQAIQALRAEVFVEEQGIGSFMISADEDPNALHLGLFFGDSLIFCITMILFRADHPRLAQLGIKTKRPFAVNLPDE
jgi:hypothetical protein